MSGFLMIIPEGWTQLDWQYITNNVADMSMDNVLDWINSGSLGNIEAPIKAAEIISQESTVVEAKLIDDTFFLVRLG